MDIKQLLLDNSSISLEQAEEVAKKYAELMAKAIKIKNTEDGALAFEALSKAALASIKAMAIDNGVKTGLRVALKVTLDVLKKELLPL